MSSTCDHFKNTVVLVATLEVKHDRNMITKFRRNLLAVRASALSDIEPVRTFHRFADAQAVMAHTQTSAYWDLHMANDLLIHEPTVLFFEEL